MVFFATNTVSMRCDGVATVSENVILLKHSGQCLCNRAIRRWQLHELSSNSAKMLKKKFFFIFFLRSLFFVRNFAPSKFDRKPL